MTKPKRKDVRTALEEFPARLNKSYNETMKRIEGQAMEYEELAKRVLLWVSQSLRPMSMLEIRHAIAVEPKMQDIDDEDMDDEDALITCYAGLIMRDGESNTLRFVRKSLHLGRHCYPYLGAMHFGLRSFGKSSVYINLMF